MGTVAVGAVTFDGFCDDHAIDRVGVPKPDVQGGELAAIAGATRLLTGRRADVVCAELAFAPHDQGRPMAWQVWAALARFGYGAFDLRPDLYAADGRLRYADAVSVPRP